MIKENFVPSWSLSAWIQYLNKFCVRYFMIDGTKSWFECRHVPLWESNETASCSPGWTLSLARLGSPTSWCVELGRLVQNPRQSSPCSRDAPVFIYVGMIISSAQLRARRLLLWGTDSRMWNSERCIFSPRWENLICCSIRVANDLTRSPQLPRKRLNLTHL